MALTISDSDFVGKYEISTNQFSNLDAFLTDADEAKLIKQVLGVTEGQAFIDDLDGNGEPQTAKYVTIFNPIDFDVYGSPEHTDGLKQILIQLFYSYYTSEQMIFNMTEGNSTIAAEAAQANDTKQIVVYNRGVDNINSLQCYIQMNRDTYTDYNGKCFEPMTLI